MDFLAADIKMLEAPPSTQPTPTVPTAVGSLLGVMKKGPFGATLVTSWPEFERLYGGFIASTKAAAAAFAFFANGGRYLYVVRVVHYTNIADPTTKTSVAASGTLTTTGASTQGSVQTANASPFALAAGDHIDFNVDGAPVAVLTFTATQASRIGVAGTYPTLFAGGETLEVALNGGVTQTISFSVGDQTLDDVVDKINSALIGGSSVESGGETAIVSDMAGTSSRCAIIGGTAAATLGLAVGFTDGLGNVGDISAVTGAEVKSLVEAATTVEVTVETDLKVTYRTPTIGAGGSIQCLAASTVDDAAKMNLDNAVHAGTPAGPGNTATAAALYDGTWGNVLAVVIAAASSGVASEFKLSVTESGTVRETYDNLTMDPTSPRYIETIVNAKTVGSAYISVTDLLAGAPPANRPTNGTYALASGNDGLVSLADSDFVGSETGGTGLYSLDQKDDVTLLSVPGRTSATVHQAMVAYADRSDKRIFPVLDPPPGLTAIQMRDYVRVTAGLYELSNSGAIYWPEVRVANPDTSVYTSDADGLVTIPPSGHALGIYARTDGATEGGVHQPPAGPERGILAWCLGLASEEAFDQRKRDLLYPVNVNPITSWSGTPIHLDGNRTLKITATWGYISERRGVSYIKRVSKLLLSFVRHANNNTALRRRATRTIKRFLTAECRAGAFETTDPATAFFVDFSEALNPPSVVQAHKLYGRIGLRKAKSVDWGIIEISQDTRGLEEELGA